MFCRACGAKVNEGNRFCTKCGSEMQNGKRVPTIRSSAPELIAAPADTKLQEQRNIKVRIIACALLSIVIVITSHFAYRYWHKETILKSNRIRKIKLIRLADSEYDIGFNKITNCDQDINDKHCKFVINHLKAAIRVNPDHANANWYLGTIYEYFEKHDDAVKYYKKYMELAPKSRKGWFKLGKNYYESGNDHVNGLYSFNSKDKYEIRKIKDWQFAKKAYDKAISSFDKYISLNDNRRDEQTYSVYYFRANTYRGLGEYYLKVRDTVAADKSFALAFKEFGHAIAIAPERPNAYFSRGRLYFVTGNNEMGFRDFEKAIRLDAKDVYWRISRARKYLELGMMEPALNDFTTAINIEPKNCDLYLERAEIYLKYKKDYMAFEDYVKAMGVCQNVASVVDAIFSDYGSIDEHDIEDTFDYLSNIVENIPDNDEVYNRIIGRLLGMDKAILALELIDRRIDLNPFDSDGYIARGRYYYYLDEYDNAIKDFDKAVELQEDCKTCYCFRHATYEEIWKHLPYEEQEKASTDTDLQKCGEMNPDILTNDEYNRRYSHNNIEDFNNNY